VDQQLQKTGNRVKPEGAKLMKTITLALICGLAVIGGLACSRNNMAVVAGNTPKERAEYVFAKYECNSCHTLGREGKFGFTPRGARLKEDSEGCVALLTSMSVIAHVPEDQRNPQQKIRASRFTEYGCAVCHQVKPGQMSLTQTGEELASLHLSCPEVQNLVARTQ
jgi:hypothetical protein